MIIIGEKINGVIPEVRKAIVERDADVILRYVSAQAQCGADYLDCAPSASSQTEYDVMLWLLELIQSSTELPVCLDSPNIKTLTRLLESGVIRRPGIVNAVSEDGKKCEALFPRLAGTQWGIVGLCCDGGGIPARDEQKIDIARRLIDKADHYGVQLSSLYLDPCIMPLATAPNALQSLCSCIRAIHAFAPEVKVIGAVSNISFNMPARKYINASCLAYALAAGMDGAILDPCCPQIRSTISACETLLRQNGSKAARAHTACRTDASEEEKTE